MSDVIDLNMDEISKKAKRIQSSLESVSNKINVLYSDILYTIGDAWKSKENYYYINNLTKYLENLKKLHDSIASYIAFLQTSVDTYEEMITESCKVSKSINKEE